MRWYGLRYGVLAAFLLADVLIIESPPWPVRAILSVALVCGCTVIPYLKRLLVPALPIITWLVTFYACQFIADQYRPHHIFVNILPTLERVLYGGNLSEIISKHQHPVLDILAWLPYGVIHFSLPFIFSFVLFVYGPPGSLDVFGQAFGWMNLAGVLTQLAFPNASPWYEMSFGSTPANYSVPGEAGGLARIDKILGLSLYSSSFGASPLVFGAFPSLHSASATIEMLFVTYRWPKFWPVGMAYTMWLWWSTMYLTHHYLIDLVGGSIYAFIAYFFAIKYLPPVDPTKKTRLQYLGQSFSINALFCSIERDRSAGRSSSRCTIAAVEPKDEEEGLLPTEAASCFDEEKPSLLSSASSACSSVCEPRSPSHATTSTKTLEK